MNATGRMPTKRVLTLERTFDAPRELVWDAWTKPEHIVHWMAASDWTTPSAETDVRPGGEFRVEMRGMNDREGFVFGGTYEEVRKPELLVQVIGDGRVMRVTFDDLGGRKTKLVLSWEMAMSEEQERGGYTQILDKFEEYVRDRRPAKPELVLTRVFDAPRELVFDVFTRPEHLLHWFGPDMFTIPSAESEPRPGGAFAVCMRFKLDGKDYWAKGTYREVKAPERIVMDMSGEGTDGRIPDTQLTVTFLERDGKTLLILHTTGIPAAEMGGASQGWSESFGKLERYLRTV